MGTFVLLGGISLTHTDWFSFFKDDNGKYGDDNNY